MPPNLPIAAPLLVLGAGAREHALARALVEGRPGASVVVAPGNGGIATGSGERLRRVPVELGDPAAVLMLARSLSPGLVVIGPEAPLCAGVCDILEEAGFLTLGPSRQAARLEGSKVALKELAARAGIPTAPFEVARDMDAARRAVLSFPEPPVVKADGLCAGKGVVVADSHDEAIAACQAMLVDRVFGDAGSAVVIERRIRGRELSVLAICDGERALVLPPARDHKRIGEQDTGPNTGGMGVVCPAPDVDADLLSRIETTLIEPTLRALREAGTPFRGVLFAGVMLDETGTPLLLEHNVRFGDPECEAVLPLLEGDVAALLASAAAGALDLETVRVRSDLATCVVVLAAHGYPGRVRTGDVITGIAEAERIAGVRVHHAGTALSDDHARLVTAGGRVLAVTAVGSSPAEARSRAYAATQRIAFDGMQFRRDIGGPAWTAS